MPENEAPHKADDEEIRRLWVRACDAWTRGDAHAYGETFTPDVDYVPYDGSLVRGRQAVVASHDRLFRGVLTGSALVGEVESIRYIDADVAIVHTMGSVLMPWRSKLPKRRLSRQTVIAVRTGEGWRFTAVHNARVRPVRIREPNSFPSRASRAMTRLGRRVGAGRHRADTQSEPQTS
ncbi:MAG TPA: SgcJ/EcaC family oxidoreductase [Jiangellaceae bacterium]|nr:SgcJ/EcaC family oxidoreductase [Jiangellaceae bacterium]